MNLSTLHLKGLKLGIFHYLIWEHIKNNEINQALQIIKMARKCSLGVYKESYKIAYNRASLDLTIREQVRRSGISKEKEDLFYCLIHNNFNLLCNRLKNL